jgi:hypothetical protein
MGSHFLPQLPSKQDPPNLCQPVSGTTGMTHHTQLRKVFNVMYSEHRKHVDLDVFVENIKHMQFTVFQKYCVVPLKTKCLMLTKIFLKQ